MLLALLAHRRWPLALLAGVALGMQHFEQGLAGFGALAGALVVSRLLQAPVEHRLAGTLATLAGIVLGKALLTAILAATGVEMLSGRTDYMLRELRRLVVFVALNPWATLYATLAVGWLVLFRFLREGRAALPLALALLALLALMPFVFDNTRVFAITSFPVLTVYWLWNRGWLMGVSRREVTALLLVWLVVPWLWVWEGRARVSVLSHDLAVVSNMVFGRPAVPEQRADWPFR
jgi:hypothetical protein